MANKKPYEVKQAMNYGTCVYGINLPKGAVYLMLPDKTIKGVFHRKAYVWVEDLRMAKRQKHFNVMMLTVNDKHPRRIYADSSKSYVRLLKAYIDNLPDDKLTTKKCIPNRDISHCGTPKDREVGTYTMRARPCNATNPYIMTEYDLRELKVYGNK